MRQFAFAAMLSALAAPIFAQEAEIEGVISSQFDAFRAGDFARAFTYASPNIRQMFGSSENFGMMVQNGYPMVHQPGDVRYGELEDLGETLRQRVIVRDGAGAFHALDYDMIEGPEGWVIDGVRLVEMPQVGV